MLNTTLGEVQDIYSMSIYENYGEINSDENDVIVKGTQYHLKAPLRN